MNIPGLMRGCKWAPRAESRDTAVLTIGRRNMKKMARTWDELTRQRGLVYGCCFSWR